MHTISICIATYRRPQLLSETLAALAKQSRPAEEIVISDAGQDTETQRVIRDFSFHYASKGKVIHCATPRKALPWQRWWAFTHSKGEVVLFLDDDVTLEPGAIEVLVGEYFTQGDQPPRERIAGIGFVMSVRGKGTAARRARSFKERWLGTSSFTPGTITPGGQTISFCASQGQRIVPVDYLWGGAMSFPRTVIEQIGLLDNLIELYAQGIGRSEDAVLSSCANRYGRLWQLTSPLAIHPQETEARFAPYAAGGWRKGWTETWTRAHTMRWMASDRSAYFAAWLRTVILEVGRGLSGVFRAPITAAAWLRVVGACVGSLTSLLNWRRIPPHPKLAEVESGLLTSRSQSMSRMKS